MRRLKAEFCTRLRGECLVIDDGQRPETFDPLSGDYHSTSFHFCRYHSRFSLRRSRGQLAPKLLLSLFILSILFCEKRKIDMLLVLGIISVVWGIIDLYAGSVLCISRFGMARYTQEDDGFIFYAFAWGQIIGGVLFIGTYFHLLNDN